MQKKLIALAVAGAMAAPLAAQAEVKVTGLMQAELINISGDIAAAEGTYIGDGAEYRAGGGVSAGNASGLFVVADHDLGNGMKGFAKVGFNVSPDATDIAGLPSMRDNYVGLSAGFGTIMAGRMTGPYKGATVKWDPLLTTALQARGTYGMSGLHNSYTANALAYTNNFGSVKLAAAYVPDEGNTAGWEASVTMPVGPVGLAVAAENNGNDTATKFGAKYSAGSLGVVAQYEQLPAGFSGAAAGAAPGSDATQLYVGASLKMGAGSVAVGYGNYDEDTGSAADGTYMAVGYLTNLSKAVRAHVGYRSAGPDNAKLNAIAAGMRVKF